MCSGAEQPGLERPPAPVDERSAVGRAAPERAQRSIPATPRPGVVASPRGRAWVQPRLEAAALPCVRGTAQEPASEPALRRRWPRQVLLPRAEVPQVALREPSPRQPKSPSSPRAAAAVLRAEQTVHRAPVAPEPPGGTPRSAHTRSGRSSSTRGPLRRVSRKHGAHLPLTATLRQESCSRDGTLAARRPATRCSRAAPPRWSPRLSAPGPTLVWGRPRQLAVASRWRATPGRALRPRARGGVLRVAPPVLWERKSTPMDAARSPERDQRQQVTHASTPRSPQVSSSRAAAAEVGRVRRSTAPGEGPANGKHGGRAEPPAEVRSASAQRARRRPRPRRRRQARLSPETAPARQPLATGS